MTHLFAGLSAFPITPADARGHVDQTAFERISARLVSAKVDSIGLLGSTGGYAYLPRGLKAELTAQAVALSGGLPVAVGVGAPALTAVLENARDAAEAGAAALLLAPVSYQPLREAELFELYRLVAAEAGLPVILYNNSGTTGVTFSPELIARIGALPGITAVKMPPRPEPGAEIAALRAALPADVLLGYSGDAMIAAAFRAGAEGWFSVLGGLFPEICREMTDAALAADWARLGEIDGRLTPVWHLFAAHGSYRVIHAAAEIAGYGPTLPPLPLLPLLGEDQRAVAAALEQAGLLQ